MTAAGLYEQIKDDLGYLSLARSGERFATLADDARTHRTYDDHWLGRGEAPADGWGGHRCAAGGQPGSRHDPMELIEPNHHRPLQFADGLGERASRYRTLEVRADVSVEEDPDLVFLDRVVRRYGQDLDTFAGEKHDRFVVTLTPRHVIARG